MKRFAFIDVQNTEITTLKVLGFILDNKRLFEYLKNKWKCEKIFFYPGIQGGDQIREKIFLELTALGAMVKPKYFSVYKNGDKITVTKCPKCSANVTHTINMGYTWKCNCDVELTSDILDVTSNKVEIILFTGDGDFEYLIKKVTAKGCLVTIVSSALKVPKGPRYSTSRLSTKLRRLTQAGGSPVRFIEINNLKYKIKKDY